jgi:hypothetical protein
MSHALGVFGNEKYFGFLVKSLESLSNTAKGKNIYLKNYSKLIFVFY